ncbi:MAG: hypothetical protein Q8930_12030 [Bacillota bacterium]|nr:hypothetical protein [Bacillota bacterium]
MLTYALLMIMLYGGENKNLKTILIIAALLGFLGKPKKKRLRRRGRRRRGAISPAQDDPDYDKTELILSAVQSVLNYININAQAKNNQQASAENASNQAGPGNSELDRDNESHSTLNSDSADNGEIQDEDDPAGNDEEIRLNGEPERNLPAAAQQVGKVDKAAVNPTARREMRVDNRLNQGLDMMEDEEFPLRRMDITEVIKDIYQGVNITVALSNGNSVDGEVIGTYQGILILRSMGILNYIRGGAIVSFS